MMQSEDVTFRQGSGKWLICNQTGEKVTRSKVRKARIIISRRLSGFQRPSKPKPVEAINVAPTWRRRLRVSNIRRMWDEVECPHCYYDVQNVFSPRTITCPNCREEFEAV